MRLRTVLLLLVLFHALSPFTGASGFSIPELGVRAMGMGGAFVAVADDGSALFYNPAGIAFQKGLRFQMDGTFIHGIFHFFPAETPPGAIVPEDGYSGFISPPIIAVPNLYMTKDFSEKWTFGFGMFSPFGLGGNWTNFEDSDPQNTKFVGRYEASRNKMISIWFQPTVAYRISPNSSIALGVAYNHSYILLEQSILNPLDDGRTFGEEVAALIFPGEDPVLAGRSIARLLPEGRTRLAATSGHFAFNLGYLYRHEASRTNIGLSFRNAITHDFEGESSFAFTPNSPLALFVGEDAFPELFPDQKVDVGFTLPATYSVGFSNSAYWNTTFAFEFQFQDYNRFKDVVTNFSQTEDTATPDELRADFGFKNSYVIRAGLERPLNRQWYVRGGYAFDRSPVPDRSVGPVFPDSNRHNFTVGTSYRTGNKELSLFYQAMQFVNREVDHPDNDLTLTNGLYRNFAHLWGFSLRFNMGGKDLQIDQ